MATLTEFYLTTVWDYKPNVVNQIIDGLFELECDQAEFAYDDEYGWFRVTCQEDDASAIRQQFGLIVRRIEADAFDKYEDDLLHWNDTLMTHFDNEWFSREASDTSTRKVGEMNESECHPNSQATYPHTKVWGGLDSDDNESYTIYDIINDIEFEELEKELDVVMSTDLAGKLVSIAGHSEESISRAQEKLTALLRMRKALDTSLWAENVLYAEDYVDPGETGFTADVRYFANIDPRLASSTLLDRVLVGSLNESYKALYRAGSSIRLCPWAPDKGFRVSLFGPKVDVYPKDRTRLSNRPAVSARAVGKLVDVAEEVILPQLPQSLNTSRQVETWIERLSVHADSVPSPVQPLLDARAFGRSETVSTSENLIDLTDEPLTYHLAMATTSDTKADPMDPDPTTSAHISLTSRDLSATLQAVPGMSSGNLVSRVQCDGGDGGEFAFTGDDCLVDLLAAVKTTSPTETLRSSIHWEMPSLIPVPTGSEEHGHTETDSDGATSVVVGSETQTTDPGTSSQMDQRRPQQAPTSKKKNRKKKGSQSTKKQAPEHKVENRKVSRPSELASSGTQPSQLPGLAFTPEDSGHFLATEDFVREIEASVLRQLYAGPYRRGRVEVRAELGRAILEEVDASGVSFNNVTTPSNGWRKLDLIKRLNTHHRENQNIHFTKILSIYACDIEDMINTRTAGTRLWEQAPACSWTIYSFHCSLRSAEQLGRFIVDIEDDGTSSGVFSYSIRLHNDTPSQDKPLPIFVHAIRRHWDVRIVTSHVTTDGVELAYGSFARALLLSLGVSHNETGVPELKFGVHSSFDAVEVNEVRVLTNWRHLSLDHKSALEITEVEQLEMVSYAEGMFSDSWENQWEGKLARPWSSRRARDNRANGEYPRWYEAAVVSVELEAMCQQNSLLGVGEKADWDAEDLKNRGLFPALYGPALQMVTKMDHIGRRDDNNLSGEYGSLLRRPNDPPRHVPGLLAAQAQGPVQNRGQRGGVVSDGSRSDSTSTQSGAALARSEAAFWAAPRRPTTDQPGFW